MRDYYIRVTAPGNEQAVRRKLAALLEFGTVRDALGDAGIHTTSVSLMPGAIASDCEIATVWEVARRHGDESEPEHEVGDLQALTRLCWQLLSNEQREIVAATFRDEIQTALE